jgi:mycothiol synthase
MQLRGLEPQDAEAAHAVLRAAGLADAAQVAREKLFGPSPVDDHPASWAAVDGGAVVGLAASSGRWLRILAVDPAARGRGIGGALLAAIEGDVRARRAPAIRTLDQPGNYLSPGIPADDDATLGWLARRGYRVDGDNHNLLVDVAGNPRVTAGRAAELSAAAAAAGYTVRRASAADRAALLAMIEGYFSRPWAFEIGRALDDEPAGVHLALDPAGAPVAFAGHDGNNRGLGWFGPAGTLPEHRGKRLGEALLVACLVDVAAAGLTTATIAWIGPRAFYQRAVGVAGERRFVVLTKELP